MPRRKEQKIEINYIREDLLRPSSHILNLNEIKSKPIFEEPVKIAEKNELPNIFLSYEVKTSKFAFIPRIWRKIKARFYFVFLPSFYFEMRKIRNGEKEQKKSKVFRAGYFIWKIIAFVFKFPVFFAQSFITIFQKSENYNEEIFQPDIAEKIRGKFTIRQMRLREAVLVFALAAFIVIAPLRLFLTYEGILEIKNKVLTAGEAALGHFASAIENPLNPSAEDFKKAANELNFANTEIDKINFLILEMAGLLPEKGEQIKSGRYLLKAGAEISEAGAILSGMLLNIKNTDNFAEKFSLLKSGMENFIPCLQKTYSYLDRVDVNLLPGQVREKFKTIKMSLDSANFSADEFSRLSDVFLGILGAPEPKRYLLIFQNNSEIRPTGGFIGSFAEIYVKNGKIVKTFFPGGGSYDLDGGLTTKLAPPEPMKLISSRWYFRDANWFPDFRVSAEKIIWFYEKSGGSTMDGVIAINAPFAERLLSFFGPVEMEKYGKILDGENFIGEVQKSVELEYNREENKPKQILADLMPIMSDKIFASSDIDDILELGRIFGESLNSKDILFYFKDENLQNIVNKLGWSGEIKNRAGDYLAIFNTNIAGQKTDKVIDEIITHESRIDSDGNIIDTVRVTRMHNGNKGEIFSGVRNVNYVRVYVPKGSMLLHADGFSAPDNYLFDTVEEGAEFDADLAKNEKIISIDPKSGTRITEEFEKTSFGNWTMVDPGKSITYSFVYKLPFKLVFKSMISSGDLKTIANAVLKRDFGSDFSTYDLFVQKQPGSSRTSFAHFTRLADNLDETWIYNNEAGEKNLKPLSTDRFYGEIIRRK
jgi:hypothetical protein